MAGPCDLVICGIGSQGTKVVLPPPDMETPCHQPCSVMENPLCDEFADLDFGTPILGKGKDKAAAAKEEQSVKTSHHSRFIDDQLLYSTCVTYESKSCEFVKLFSLLRNENSFAIFLVCKDYPILHPLTKSWVLIL